MEQETEEGKKGLGLRPGQLMAGALAAVTAAVLGSFLGVEGTVIGAGVASVISTVGSALYSASLDRTKKAAQLVARNTGALRAQEPVPSQRQAPTRQQQPATRQQQPPTRQQQPPTRQQQQQPQRTQQLQNAARASRASVYRPVDPAATIADLATPLHEQRTQVMRPADPARTEQLRSGPEQTQQRTQPPVTERPWWLRHWKRLAVLTVGAFAIGLAVVTGIELLNGGTLAGDRGTSVGGFVTGHVQKVDKPTEQQPDNTGGTGDTSSTPTPTEPTPTDQQQPGDTDGATPSNDPDSTGDQDPTDQQQQRDGNTGQPTPQQMPVPGIQPTQ